VNHLIHSLLACVLLLIPLFQSLQADPDSQKTDRERRGYLGPVRKASTQGQTLSRRLYRESPDGKRKLVEDTTNQFGGKERQSDDDFDEFDEHGRLVADADFDRAMDQEPFRLAYHYGADGRLATVDHFNESGEPTGRTEYFYGPDGKRTEQLNYSPEGVLRFKTRYDDYGNVIENLSFTADGSVAHRESTAHTYHRVGNTLEDSYALPERSGGLIILPGPGTAESATTQAAGPRIAKNVYTYSDSGRLLKRDLGGMEETYDENGRRLSFSLGPVLTTYSYDDQGHMIEQRVSEPTGPMLLSGGVHRSVFKYDAHGNETERNVYGPDGRLMLQYTWHYDYDSYGNWIKCVEKEEVFNSHKDLPDAVLQIVTTRHRTISYF